MRMDEGWDTGDVLLMRQIPIDQPITLAPFMTAWGHWGRSLTCTLAGLTAGTVKPVPQNHAEATYVLKHRGRSGFIVG